MEGSNRNLVIVLVVLAIVAVCCVALVAGAFVINRVTSGLARSVGDFGNFSARTTFSRSFDVSTPASLNVDVRVGSVEVRAGSDSAIQVDGTVTAYGLNTARAEEYLDRVRLDAQQSGQEVIVTADWDEPVAGWQGRSPEVDLVITVPERTAIELDLDVGEVDVVGTAGDLSINTDVGRVTVRDVAAEESLEIQTDVAEINFEAALTEGAQYEFASDVGSITLDLPADSSFQLQASSDVGDVSVEFDVVGEQERDFVGETVRGTVGGPSDTVVIARSNVGSVRIR